jgi:hypothetical protein
MSIKVLQISIIYLKIIKEIEKKKKKTKKERRRENRSARDGRTTLQGFKRVTEPLF